MGFSVILRARATSSIDPPHRGSVWIESISPCSFAIANSSSQLLSDFQPDGDAVFTSAISVTSKIIFFSSFLVRFPDETGAPNCYRQFRVPAPCVVNEHLILFRICLSSQYPPRMLYNAYSATVVTFVHHCGRRGEGRIGHYFFGGF